MSTMNQTPQLDLLGTVSSLLAGGIPETSPTDMPVEVSEVLLQAKAQMDAIPSALEELHQAWQEFDLLDRHIERLIELAREAAAGPEEDQGARLERQEEFIGSARVVAGLAGRLNYDQPRLSVATKAQAKASYQALKHLVPVKSTLADQLREQEENIKEAVEGTIGFLSVIAEAYPESAAVEEIASALEAVRRARAGLARGRSESGLH